LFHKKTKKTSTSGNWSQSSDAAAALLRTANKAVQESLVSMELLAPAGSFPAFEAALEAGADAIYVGAPGFNARALSRDLSLAEIGSMIQQAHQQGVRLYIAMNSLVKEAELPLALEHLSSFEALGPDALIVQDLGLLHLARTWFPRLPLHASTLLSVHNSLAADTLTRLGCQRVVLAREMSIEEIALVHERSSADLEVFVHGAMCFSYSGLCLFSSLHGGKSSLRGHCVQPCRRRYAWQGRRRTATDAGYLFSMKDLCGLELLPALRQAGVRCLKIEGRLKSAHAVGSTVAAYRLALDCLDQPEAVQEEALQEARRLVAEGMGRRQSTAYLLSTRAEEALSPEQSGNSGLLLGAVQRAGKRIQVTLLAPIHVGDRLRLHDEDSGERISFTLRFLYLGGQPQPQAQAGQKVEIQLTPEQAQALSSKLRGSLFRVDVEARRAAERSARKRTQDLSGQSVPVNRDKVREILKTLAWKPSPESKRQGGKRRPPLSEPEFWLLLPQVNLLRQRLPVPAQRLLFPLDQKNIELLRQGPGRHLRTHKSRLAWQLPPIIQEADLAWFQEQIHSLVAAGFHNFSLGHCSQTALFSAHKHLNVIGHYTLNLLNGAALRAAAQQGFKAVMFSVETEGHNLGAALSHFRQQAGPQRMQLGMYAYGHLPLFTSRLSSPLFRWKQPLVSPQEEQFFIEQDQGLTKVRSSQPFSLLQRRHELAAAGVDFLLLDLTGVPIQQGLEQVQFFLQPQPQRKQGGKGCLQGNMQGVLV
jgi:putative protease